MLLNPTSKSFVFKYIKLQDISFYSGLEGVQWFEGQYCSFKGLYTPLAE